MTCSMLCRSLTRSRWLGGICDLLAAVVIITAGMDNAQAHASSSSTQRQSVQSSPNHPEACPETILLIATNPVDIIPTLRLICRRAGHTSSRVIGSGPRWIRPLRLLGRS
jgi:hypothetical protein